MYLFIFASHYTLFHKKLYTLYNGIRSRYAGTYAAAIAGRYSAVAW